MLIESLVKATVELQGFRVVNVTGDTSGLRIEVAADGRFAPRCGRCGERAKYRDTRTPRRFRHVPLWGIDVQLTYAASPRGLRLLWRCSCRGDAVSIWQAAIHPRP